MAEITLQSSNFQESEENQQDRDTFLNSEEDENDENSAVDGGNEVSVTAYPGKPASGIGWQWGLQSGGAYTPEGNKMVQVRTDVPGPLLPVDDVQARSRMNWTTLSSKLSQDEEDFARRDGERKIPDNNDADAVPILRTLRDNEVWSMLSRVGSVELLKGSEENKLRCTTW